MSGIAFGATVANGISLWVGDTGASSHMINDPTYIYDRTFPAHSKSYVILRDSTLKEVVFVGELDLVFHFTTEVKAILDSICFLLVLCFNLLSLHGVQGKHRVFLDSTGLHTLNGLLTFPKRRTGSYLQVTRVSQGM